jgi:DNA-binding CsgD family transcriptional regulator
VALAASNDRAALALLRAAADGPFGHRAAALIADARVRLAEVLARLGGLDDARAGAGRAVALLARWPGWRLQEARTLQRRLGAGASGRPHELLTPREREVCLLLARGWSNKEIAEHLFISRKTASVHVSNILAKTGLKRRGQVAAWVHETGLSADS